MHRTDRPTKKTIPINVILDERSALVVGGGQVGWRKTRLLLDAGAAVEIVCPDAVEELAALAREGRISWTRREWRPGDAASHLLVFACTDDKHVNRAVLDDARLAHVPCCCADMNWPDGDFTTPATARVGDLTLAVSTGGQSCREARMVKDDFVRQLAARRNLDLFVIGTSDAILPSRKRAPYHLPAEERAVLGQLIRHVKGLAEFFILNTCNRVEIAIVAEKGPNAVNVVKRLAGFDHLAPDEQFIFSGYEAFRHLTRVASGLESSLMGEFHIVSQMKDALDEAEANNWGGPAVRYTGAEVLRVSKAVRHAVEGMLRVAEIDQVAVRYLSVHGGLDPSVRVVVVGTGMVGTGVVEALAKTGVAIDWIYHSRVPDTARFGKDANIFPAPLSELPARLAAADIALSAVDSSKPVITPSMRDAVADRNVLFVDLGVPRNIDTFFDDYGHGVTVADLDDLKLWHRVKTGTINDVLSKADEVIRSEYRAML
jgi:glutamyl-tRNA reductase